MVSSGVGNTRTGGHAKLKGNKCVEEREVEGGAAMRMAASIGIVPVPANGSHSKLEFEASVAVLSAGDSWFLMFPPNPTPAA